RRLSAVIPAIDMETRRIEMAKRGRQPQAPGRRGGNEAGEGRHPRLVQCIERAPERVIMEMAGLNAWSNEARDRLMLEKMGDEVALLVDKTEPVEHHSFEAWPAVTMRLSGSCCVALSMTSVMPSSSTMPATRPR